MTSTTQLDSCALAGRPPRCVTDEVISDMADRIDAAVAERQTTAIAEHQGVVDLDTERRRRR